MDKLMTFWRILTKRNSKNKRYVNQRGFSLIELLIVMVILGLLASLVGPRMFGQLGKAKQKTAKTQIEMLLAGLDTFRLDVGRYPTYGGDGGLEALVIDPGIENWDGPYINKSKLPLDPWGRPYGYRTEGEYAEVEIFSYGRDGNPGGEGEDADVVSWE